MGDLLDRTFAGTHRLGHTAPAIHRGFLQTRLADPACAESFWMLSLDCFQRTGLRLHGRAPTGNRFFTGIVS